MFSIQGEKVKIENSIQSMLSLRFKKEKREIFKYIICTIKEYFWNTQETGTTVAFVGRSVVPGRLTFNQILFVIFEFYFKYVLHSIFGYLM